MYWISGGIGVKTLEVVDWSQVLNRGLESAAATRISRSRAHLKLLQASSWFLKQHPEPESVVTEISW